MIRLYNRGDGVNGHYCVGRLMKDSLVYHEFWNAPLTKWCASGTIYTRDEGEQLIEKFNTEEILCGIQQ